MGRRTRVETIPREPKRGMLAFVARFRQLFRVINCPKARVPHRAVLGGTCGDLVTSIQQIETKGFTIAALDCPMAAWPLRPWTFN